MPIFHIPMMLAYEGSTEAFVEAESADALRQRVFDDLVAHIGRCRRDPLNDRTRVLILGRKYVAPCTLLYGDIRRMYDEDFALQLEPSDISLRFCTLEEYVSIRLIKI